jgi:hypothetical protein
MAQTSGELPISERGLAILGSVAIVIAAIVALVFYDNPTIGIVSGILALGFGQINNLLKQGEASQKIDANTVVTVKAANKLSQQNALQSEAISDVADKTNTIEKTLNGGFNERVRQAVKPDLDEIRAKVESVHAKLDAALPKRSLSDHL